MHDLLSRDEGIALLVGAVVFLFVGPTVRECSAKGSGSLSVVTDSEQNFSVPNWTQGP